MWRRRVSLSLSSVRRVSGLSPLYSSPIRRVKSDVDTLEKVLKTV